MMETLSKEDLKHGPSVQPKTEAPKGDTPSVPVLGPGITLTGGALVFAVAATGSVIAAQIVMAYTAAPLWAILGVALAVGLALKSVGHYLTLRAQKRSHLFNFLDSLFGVDPEQSKRVTITASVPVPQAA